MLIKKGGHVNFEKKVHHTNLSSNDKCFLLVANFLYILLVSLVWRNPVQLRIAYGKI